MTSRTLPKDVSLKSKKATDIQVMSVAERGKVSRKIRDIHNNIHNTESLIMAQVIDTGRVSPNNRLRYAKQLEELADIYDLASSQLRESIKTLRKNVPQRDGETG